MRDKRVVLAFLIAPLIPSILLYVVAGDIGKNWVIMMLLFSVFFSYLPSLLFGIPFVLWLQKKNRFNLINVMIFGAVAGMMVLYVFRFIFAAILDSSASLVPGISDLIWGAILGISVALPFSLIAGIPMKKKIM